MEKEYHLAHCAYYRLNGTVCNCGLYELRNAVEARGYREVSEASGPVHIDIFKPNPEADNYGPPFPWLRRVISRAEIQAQERATARAIRIERYERAKNNAKWFVLGAGATGGITWLGFWL